MSSRARFVRLVASTRGPRTAAVRGFATTACAITLCALGLTACGRPAFPAELFTIKAEDGADYPFMLSETQAPEGKGSGRALTAESGTRASMSQSRYSTGNTTVTVTRTMEAQSELPASTKVAAQVRRKDRWVRMERATFTAMDFSSIGSTANERLLTIDATAHK